MKLIIYRLYLTVFCILGLAAVVSGADVLRDRYNADIKMNSFRSYLSARDARMKEFASEMQKKSDAELTDIARGGNQRASSSDWIDDKSFDPDKFIKTELCLDELLITGGYLYECNPSPELLSDALERSGISGYDKLGASAVDYRLPLVWLALAVSMVIIRQWLSWLTTGKFARRFP